MKLLMTAGVIFALAASSYAQQVKIPGEGTGPAGGTQSVKPAGAASVPGAEAEPAKTTIVKSTAPVAAAKSPAKKKKTAKTAADKSASPVPAVPVKSSETAPSVKPATAAPGSPAPIKAAVHKAAPGIVIIKPTEDKPAAAPVKPAAAPLKPVEAVKPAAAPVKPAAAIPVKPVEAVKPVAAPVKPAAAIPVKQAEAAKPAVQPAVKQSPPAAAGKQETALILAGRDGGFVVTRKHLVVKGDTLWDLSAKYYGTPFRWGKIYTGNLDKISNPDRIYPKEEINIPEMTEVVNPLPKPENVTDMEAPESEEGTDIPVPAAAARPGADKIALARSAKSDLKDFDQVMSEEMPEDQMEWAQSVKIVPDNWTANGIITGVVKSDDETLGGGFSVSSGLTSSGEVVMIKTNKTASFKPGDIITSYLKGSTVVDSDGEELGRQLQKTGMLEVLSVNGSSMKARVIDAVTSIDSDQIIMK